MGGRINVSMTIEGSDVSAYLIGYTREQNICTGIATITIDFSPDMADSFKPWDKVKLYENDGHVGTYYVNTVSRLQPSAIWQIVAQDASKRLTDHFIEDSYTIDYPSSSLYWLDLFITDTGLEYKIDGVVSEPTLLSNNTQLGLCSNYDQVMLLLQMNGWYMYFDVKDVCHIGKLDLDLSQPAKVKWTNKSILSISKIKHDKMLRNRIVVYGAADPIGSGYITADVSVHTPWNYDYNDLRTAVISNSNIPSVSAALMIAGIALNEFAKITVEKHLTIRDAINLHVGQIGYVKSRVWSGKGLITTFGTSLSKEGLVTNAILDERCPRLFGFWDWGDFVYAATYGDGVYGKRIRFDPNWYDFSDGLNDLKITDLHVSSSIFGAVSSSGELYLATDAPYVTYSGLDYSAAAGPSGVLLSGGLLPRGTIVSGIPWSGIPIDPLGIYVNGVLDPSRPIYSGLKARAVIMDRDSNLLRAAADTSFRENYGDYLFETDWKNLPTLLSGVIVNYITSGLSFVPMGPLNSGYLPLSDRSCVIDVNPESGTVDNVWPVIISGTQISGVYGLFTTYSGVVESGISVYDIENDTFTDYISVGVTLTGMLYMGPDLGKRTYQAYPGPGWNVNDPNTVTYINPGTRFSGFEEFDEYSLNEYERPIGIFWRAYDSERDLITFDSDVNKFSRWRYSKDGDGYITASGIVSPAIDNGVPLMVQKKYGYDDVYEIFFSNPGYYASGGTYTFYKYTWNSTLNSITRDTVGSYTTKNLGIPIEAYGDFLNFVVGEDAIYVVIMENYKPYHIYDAYIYLTEIKINPIDSTFTKSTFYALETQHPTWNVRVNCMQNFMFPYKKSYQVLLPYSIIDSTGSYEQTVEVRRVHRVRTSSRLYTDEQIYKSDPLDISMFYYPSVQTEGSIVGNTIVETSVNDENALISFYVWLAYYNPGLTFQNVVITTNGFDSWYRVYDVNEGEYDKGKAFWEYGDNVFGIYGRYDRTFLALSGEDFYAISSTELEPLNKQTNPPTLELYAPYPVRDSFTNEVYWIAYNSFYDRMDHITMFVNSPGTAQRNFMILDDGVGKGSFTKGQRTENSMNFFFINPTTYFYYDNNPVISAYGAIYLVLQRDGQDFYILKSGWYPDRLDISKYSPMVVMERTIESTEAMYISSDGAITDIINPGISGFNMGGDKLDGKLYGSGILSHDYRYSDFQWGASGFAVNDPALSGMMERDLLIAYDEGLGEINLTTLDNFSGMFPSPSGVVQRLEITNNVFPDQFIFVAVSGIENYQAVTSGWVTESGVTVLGEWGFFQKDPSGTSGWLGSGLGEGLTNNQFVDYSSGYPYSRTTILRIDERV